MVYHLVKQVEFLRKKSQGDRMGLSLLQGTKSDTSEVKLAVILLAFQGPQLSCRPTTQLKEPHPYFTRFIARQDAINRKICA